MSRPKHQTRAELAAKPVEASGFESAKARKGVEATLHPAVRKRLADMPGCTPTDRSKVGKHEQ